MQTTLTDDQLLGMMRAGDESALVALYRRRQGGIYRFALRMSGSQTLAEDVTQDVFLSLIHDNSRYDSTRGSFTAYLYGIARNQVLRRIEKDRSLLPLDQDEDERKSLSGDGNGLHGLVTISDPLGDLTRREEIENLRQAVLALPAHYREVVVLCDLQEMSYADAAEAIGCAVGTVRSRLHRARALLLEKLRTLKQAERDSDRTDLARCFI